MISYCITKPRLTSIGTLGQALIARRWNSVRGTIPRNGEGVAVGQYAEV